MTREEAIEDLLRHYTGESTEMAIKALEQDHDAIHNEREQAYMEGYEDASKRYRKEPSEDAISRQAVLNTLDKMDDALDEDRTVEIYKMLLTECVTVLPSVTPKQKMGRWVKISPARIYECSECGQNVMTGDIDAYRHCHGCGAKMAESEES